MIEEKKTKVKRSLIAKVLDVGALCVMLFIIIYLVVVWGDLPEEIPNHYNLAGEVDGWGGKGSLLPIPIIGGLMWIGISIIERFPQIFNYPVKVTKENKERLRSNSILMVNITKNIILLFMCLCTWRTIESAQGNPWTSALLDLFLFVVLLLGSIGYFMYRMYKLR